MQYLIDAVASDGDFRRRLAEDPLGVARTEGYDVVTEEVLDLLGLREVPADELGERLHLRLSRLNAGKWM